MIKILLPQCHGYDWSFKIKIPVIKMHVGTSKYMLEQLFVFNWCVLGSDQLEQDYFSCDMFLKSFNGTLTTLTS